MVASTGILYREMISWEPFIVMTENSIVKFQDEFYNTMVSNDLWDSIVIIYFMRQDYSSVPGLPDRASIAVYQHTILRLRSPWFIEAMAIFADSEEIKEKFNKVFPDL